MKQMRLLPVVLLPVVAVAECLLCLLPVVVVVVAECLLLCLLPVVEWVV
jgi:hypothetical protein